VKTGFPLPCAPGPMSHRKINSRACSSFIPTNQQRENQRERERDGEREIKSEANVSEVLQLP
jgi:hypothetical protein